MKKSKHDLIGNVFFALFIFMILFGLYEIIFLQRIFGWVALFGGLMLTVFHWMKTNNKLIFKPQPEKTEVTEPPTIARIITIILCFLIASGMIYYGWNWHKQNNENMERDCKMCSIFEKNCPYTDEELIEEEYSNGPCGDMGSYELLFKGTLGLMFLGIAFFGISIATIISAMIGKKPK